jgi:dsRNA-specific ribonuclease
MTLQSSSFHELIESVLKRSNLKKAYVQVLLEHINLYQQAFTSDSYDPTNNYQVFEQLGDVTINKFLVWYFYRRFPQLNCADGVKVVARLRINFASKNSFSAIAENLGFWPHIKASTNQKEKDRKSLLEDVLEAFIGVTEAILDNVFQVGVGYAVSYDILKSLFDPIHISLKYEDLYDPKSRLKEIFDANKELGSLNYGFSGGVVVVSRIANGKEIILGRGSGNQKAEAQQMASKQALEVLAKEGYTRKVEYALLCQ